MGKYEFDTVRWLRNVADIQSHRAGAGPAMLRENMLKCAVEIERLRMADDLHQQGAELMREELAEVRAELAESERHRQILTQQNHELLAKNRAFDQACRAMLAGDLGAYNMMRQALGDGS